MSPCRALVDLYSDELLARHVAFRGDTALHKLQIDPPVRYSEVEINTREHFCVLGLRRMRYQLDSPWHAGATDVLTYELEELLGTKLRALCRRKRGGIPSISRRRLPARAVWTSKG